MIRLRTFLMMMSVAILAVSCEKTETIDPDKTIAKEGNYWDASVTGYDNATLDVTNNDGGIVTAQIQFGSDNLTVTGKVTEHGIEDYVYSNGDQSKPFKLVNFDDPVGTTWQYNIGTQTVTREVTHKSTTDDTFFGWLLIKVSEVEETIPSGIDVMGRPSDAKKIVWSFNHRFGFISAVITMEDDEVVYVNTIDTNTDTQAK